MCGIFGIVDRHGNSDDVQVLSALAECLVHRGPDNGGGLATDQVSIGMQRLAIIDQAGGMQPLWNERRTVALVANGEIYNFIELRRDLEKRGHRFATASDCEVIAHLYEDFGSDCLHHLRGMFAFALVDFEARRVLIARDRIGEKPLYLHETADRIVFASELQALVGAGVVPFVLNEVAVRDYFMWGYVPEPDSPVLGTRKLPAGSLLEICLDRWSVRERRWWSPDDVPELTGDPGELLSEALAEIGTLTIRSDVPVGVALSGGVDSSALASLACDHASGDIHTFTVGYEENHRHDESDLAADFASTLGTRHHRVMLETSQVAKEFPRMCTARDEPIHDLAGAGYLALVEAARTEGVPVLLFGQGADELFWGYPWTVDAVRANLRKEAMLAGVVGLRSYLRPSPLPRSYTGLIAWTQGCAGFRSGLDAWRRDRESPPGQAVFFDHLPEWSRTAGALQRAATAGFLDRVRDVRPERQFTFSELPVRPDIMLTELLLSTYLLSNGINQADRLSMSQSVECRLPLVDYRLVEIVIGLRRRIQDWESPPKSWLREALGQLLPSSIFERPKRGFTPPWRTWSRAIFRDHAETLVDGILVQAGVLRPMTAAPNPFDTFGRPAPLALQALILEMWAQGLRGIERSNRPARVGAVTSTWSRPN